MANCQECTIKGLGGVSRPGCCTRVVCPDSLPLCPAPFSGPPPTFYRPVCKSKQKCIMPTCYPYNRVPQCCWAGGICNPRKPPPGTCPKPWCCVRKAHPKKCIPPQCCPCTCPCCPPPLLLPVPAYNPCRTSC